MFRSDGTQGFVRNLTLVALFALLVCLSLSAQTTSGTIFGTVKDPSGAVVPKAEVVVKSEAIGLERKTAANDSGNFTVPNLLPGTYTITVSAPGFKTLEKRNIILTATDKLNSGDFVLPVGSTQNSVTVTADAGQLQIQSSSGERSDLISSKQLNDVALNGRQVLEYTKLVPGVVSSVNGAVSGTGGLDQININGTRANEHEFTIDGASNVDTGNNGGTHVTLNPDSIAEVKILTSNYQAEFGKAAGGQIILTTKSGTSDFHGNARFFHRHEGLNANNYFAKQDGTPIALFRENNIGYQFGGPVLFPGTDFNKNKDKLFFFWSQEFYRQLIPSSDVTQFYTPTALERQGDFSQSKDGNGNPILITGPGVTNNKIDRSALTPAQQGVFDQMQKMLNLYPLPNVTGQSAYNYSTTLSYDDPRREDIIRIDYQLSQSNRLYGRYLHNAEALSAPILPWPGLGTFACAGAINLAGGCTSSHPGWNLSVNLVSTITPTIVNEFSVGPSVTRTYTSSVGGNFSRGKNGINLPLLYPVGSDESIPDLGFGGIPGVNFGWSYLGATPWYQANTTINLNDNLTIAKGNHTIKTGAFYQRSRKDQIAWGNINGQFSFSNSQTAPANCPANTTCGDPYASALLGMFQSFSQSSARPRGAFRYNQLEFYGQDTWKVTSRLTLDYGMRFAWIPPQYDANNQIAIFDPAKYDPAQAVTVNPDGTIDLSKGGNPLNGMEYTANGTAPDGAWNSRGIMPEPRFGFAYDLFGHHNTVLRGGAGMMHDRTQGNLIFNTVFNNPALVVTPQVSNNNVSNLPSMASNAEAGLNSPLSNIFGAAQDGKVPTVYSFSLGVQQNLGAGITLDAAYVGTLGRHLVTSRDINAIPYGYAFTREAQDPSCFAGGVVPTVEPNLPAQYSDAGYSFSGQCALGRAAYTNAPLVPYKGYGQISYLAFNGTSNYNSLQLSLQRRFSRGLTFGAVYTWSKTLTTANADQDTTDAFLPRQLDYRSAGWDRTHVLAINYVYDIPSPVKKFGGPKWLGLITDNFQLSGVTQFMTGTPVDLNNGWSFESGALDGSNMWGAIPYYYTLDNSGNLITPRIGVPLRGSRDILRNPGMQNWDMSLFKNIHLGNSESRYIQLRLEAFNAFNHVNYASRYYNVDVNGPWQWNSPSTPVTATKSSNWGQNASQASGIGGPRVVQLGAKLYF